MSDPRQNPEKDPSRENEPNKDPRQHPGTQEEPWRPHPEKRTK